MNGAVFLVTLLYVKWTFALSVQYIEFEFNRNYTGVQFIPYVKDDPPFTAEKVDTYNTDDVKVMLEVVSTRFSRIYIATMDTKTVPYERNYTYYFHTRARGRTAEVAALINKESHQKLLTVVLGIYIHDHHSRTETETMVALEAAQIANNIYPGTVEEIVITRLSYHFVPLINKNMYWIQRIQNLSSNLSLKIGLFEECDDYVNFATTLDANPATEKMIQLKYDEVNMVDFVICAFVFPEQLATQKQKGIMEIIVNKLGYYRTLLRQIKGNLHVMVQTYWPSNGCKPWYNIENMKNYWMAMDQFAVKFDYPVWLEGAFDIPRAVSLGPEFPYLGWWKLKENGLIQNASGYVEKIFSKTLRKYSECDGDERRYPEASDSMNPVDAFAPIPSANVGATNALLPSDLPLCIIFIGVTCIYVTAPLFLYFTVITCRQ